MTTQREQSRALIAETFPVFPTSLAALRYELEMLRATRIRLVISEPKDPALPTAFWARLSPTVDLIWVDATIGPVHQLVATCHEFGHMLHQHRPSTFAAGGHHDHGVSRAAVACLAGVPDDEPTALLGRCGTDIPVDDVDDRRRESEAETTGRLLARPFMATHHGELAQLLIAC